MYLTDSKLNLPVQTARKLVLAPSPFDDYLEMNPTRRSRIFVHRVSAINKPKNTLRPDNPGWGVRGRREGGRRDNWGTGVWAFASQQRLSGFKSRRRRHMCVALSCCWFSLFLWKVFSRGLWFPPQVYVCNGLWEWVGRLPCIGPMSPVCAHPRRVGLCSVKLVKRKTRF